MFINQSNLRISKFNTFLRGTLTNPKQSTRSNLNIKLVFQLLLTETMQIMAIIIILNLTTEKIDLRIELLKLTLTKRNVSTFESLSNTSINFGHTIGKRNTFGL